jgi:putative transposase
MISAVELAPMVGVAAACAALGVVRATYYRGQQPTPCQPTRSERTRSKWALKEVERQDILALLHAPAYTDKSPRTVYALLLDAGRYLASVSTFYRLLRSAGETRGRRNQLTHPVYAKPELLAQRPGELWSWDIERHEALSDRATVRDRRGPAVAAAGHKLRAA